MSQIPWSQAFAVFLGTLPLLGAVIWNAIKVDRLEKRLDATNSRLDTIINDLAAIRERVATLEERDRWGHRLVNP